MKNLSRILLAMAATSVLPATANINDSAVQLALHDFYGPVAVDTVFECKEGKYRIHCDDNGNITGLRHGIGAPEHLNVDMSVFTQLESYTVFALETMQYEADIIPPSLTQLTGLKEVTVHLGQHQSFNLPLLASIERLTITAASNLTLPAIVSGFSSLTELTLRADNIDLSSLPLNVNDLLIDSNNTDFSALTNMNNLNSLTIIDSERVDNLPISSLGNLTVFTWYTRSIEAFEQYTFYLSQLGNLTPYSLSFNNKGLTQIPSYMGDLVGLEHLFLTNNQITEIPASLLNSNLKTLNLSHNNITALPDVMTSSLQYLTLSNNQLTALPSTMGTWLSLRSLFLSNNALTELPDIGTWPALENLDFSNNSLTELPNNIGSWQALQSLDISHNKIDSLPESMADLSSLNMLNLSFNRLTSVPDTLFTLPQLTQLDLSYNFIQSSLDENVFLNLGTKLETINLSDNLLQGKLPDFSPNAEGKPVILINNNALWHADKVVVDKYSGIASQLLPPRGVKVAEHKKDWTIEWGFPLMHDTAGKHINSAFGGPNLFDDSASQLFTSRYYRIRIERTDQETEIIDISCIRFFTLKPCPTFYEADYTSFETDYRNLTAIYRYKGDDLTGATVSVVSTTNMFEFSALESSPSFAGTPAESDMYLDELDYQLQKVPEIGSTSSSLLLMLCGLLLLSLRHPYTAWRAAQCR
ncbi:MAG: leucine-rich repeat domain-containing protein [Pseudomonadales bacterium]|nr:leucine-rich repeat domain-containing protein [Pseudomonadales bacterium]